MKKTLPDISKPMMLKLAYYLIITGIVAISFYFFSPLLTPSYNSDHAIQVLMTHYLQLPNDLYYWGQNRLGSLVPILSYIVSHFFLIKPIISISIVQYLLILIIFLTFSQLFSRTISKVLLAVVLFLPLSIFETLVQISHPYTPSLALIGSAIFIFNKKDIFKENTHYKNIFLVFIGSTLLFLSIWISEISILYVLCIVAYIITIIAQPNEKISINNKKILALFKQVIYPKKSNLIIYSVIIISGIICLLFIVYAKASAVSNTDYDQNIFNDIHQVKEVLIRYYTYFINTLTFNWNDNFMSGCLVVFIITILYLFYLTYRHKEYTHPLSPWYYVLFSISILYSLLLITSKWIYLNDTNPRYASGLYLTVWMLLLLYVEKFQRKEGKIAYILVALMATLTSLSSFVRFIYPHKQPQFYQTFKAFDSYAPAGIIGDYWTSYLLGSMSPGKLACTPHDYNEFVRNPSLVDSTFKKPIIYLIKNGWLNEFPDKIIQFGYILKKIGNEIDIQGLIVAPYMNMGKEIDMKPGSSVYFAEHLFTQCSNATLVTDAENELHKIYHIADTNNHQPCYYVYGPYSRLEPGKYKVIFTLQVENNSLQDKVITIDLFANGITYKSKEVKGIDFTSKDNFQDFELDFENKEIINRFESRVFFFGKSKIWFKKVLIQKQ